MKRKLMIRKYQGGGLNYIQTDPRISNQFQSEISKQQQLGQYSTSPQQNPNFMQKYGRVAGMAGSAYYGSQQSQNVGDQTYNTTMAGVSQAGPIGGVIGGVTAMGDAIGKPIRQSAEEQDPITGSYKNQRKAVNTAGVGGALNPFKGLTESINAKKEGYGSNKDIFISAINPIGGAMNITKKKNRYLQEQKQLADWNKSLAETDIYRQQNPQQYYNPTFPKGGVTTSPEEDPYYSEYQKKLNLKQPDLRNKAELYYYSTLLNTKLREKNSQVYDELTSKYGWNPSKPLSPKTRTTGADAYATANPDFYLSSEEQKKILGDKWNRYSYLRGVYGKDIDLLGSGDDPSKPETWKVGARHAVAFNPVKYEYTKVPEKGNVKDRRKSDFLYSVSYNPLLDNPYIENLDYNTEVLPEMARGGYHMRDPLSMMYGNAELEDNEIFRTPDGDIEKVNGRTHAQGGEVYNLPEGTEILGKNKAPNGKSYKENGDRLARQFNKYNKILSNKPTRLAERTALMMLDKVHNQYSDLMNTQEMEKEMYLDPEDAMEFACGGVYKGGGWIGKAAASIKRRGTKGKCTPITKPGCTGRAKALAKTFKKIAARRRKHEDGGLVDEMNQMYATGGQLPQWLYEARGKAMERKGYPMYQYGGIEGDDDKYLTRQPGKSRSFISKQDARTAQGFFGPDYNDVVETRLGSPRSLTPRGVDRYGMPSPIPGSTGQFTMVPTTEYQQSISPRYESVRFTDETPDAWYNKAFETAGQYAPIAYNLYQGLFGKPERMNPEDYQNPYENQAMSLMKQRRYNVDPELEANRLATADYYRNLRQGAPSQGRYLAGLQSGQIARQRADAEAYARKQNIDNQYIGEEAGMLGGFGQQRASTKFSVENINAANRAAQRAYVPTALSQLQQASQSNKIMREKERLMRNKALRDEERQRIMEEYFKGYGFN